MAAARRRRALRARRPLVITPVLPVLEVTAELTEGSMPRSGADAIARAGQVRALSQALRRDTHVLRNTVGWQLRRLHRTQRLLECSVVRLDWCDSTDGLDDLDV